MVALERHIRDGDAADGAFICGHERDGDIRLPGRRAADGVERGDEVRSADIVVGILTDKGVGESATPSPD